MWTIGGADRLRFPRFPSKLEKRGNARLRPHTHRPRQQGELIIDDSKNHTRPAERTNGVHVKSVDTKSPIQACPSEGWGHRLLSFDVVLRADIPHRRLRPTDQDQKQA